MASAGRASKRADSEAAPAAHSGNETKPRPQIYLGFWGRFWQEDEEHRRLAAEVIARLSGAEWDAGPLVQASYYYNNGWYSHAAKPQLSTRIITDALQHLIGREVAPEPDSRNWGPSAYMILALDESVTLAGAKTPEVSHHGVFKTLFGNDFCYGVVDGRGRNVEDLCGRLAAMVAAIHADPRPEGDTKALPGLPAVEVGYRRVQKIGARNSATPLPSLYVEHRVPRYRVDPQEVENWLAAQSWPLAIEELPGAATIFKQAAASVEAKAIARATRPMPASEAELHNFASPNARVTIPERFVALRNKVGHDNPDAALLERILAGVSEPQFAKMRAAYHNNGAANFLDIVYWSYHKLNLARQLGLDSGPPMNVWDIGCGGGHFARICKYFGHTVVGTDQEHPVYRDIGAALGVERTIDLIIADQPTTDFGLKFDLVTAMAIEFNHHFPRTPTPKYWTLDQWRYLLNDLMARQLRYPARIYFDLNCEHRDGKGTYNLDLLRLCAANGAHSDERRGIIDWRLEGPIQV